MGAGGRAGSDKWNAVGDELIALDFTLDPTFTIYQATRDFMRARTAEWHQDCTPPVDSLGQGVVIAQSGVVQARVTDWRTMVDSVMIDTDYDGVVFNVVHADVPARKADFVAGEYTLDVPEGGATVAVKITDMLGEEVLTTHVV